MSASSAPTLVPCTKSSVVFAGRKKGRKEGRQKRRNRKEERKRGRKKEENNYIVLEISIGSSPGLANNC